MFAAKHQHLRKRKEVFLMLVIQRARDVIEIAKVQMRKVEMEIQGVQVGWEKK